MHATEEHEMKCSEVGDPYTKLSNPERDACRHPCGSSIPMTPAITARAPLGWARFGSSWLGAMKESVRMENHDSKKCLKDSKLSSLAPISRGLAVILVALFLFACRSGSAGSEFVGKWVEIGNSAVKVEIKSTGNQYIVTLTDTSGRQLRYVGQLNQKTIKLSGGIPGETISYMENSDSLDWRGDLFKRAE
jgi:hypothetical protein